MDGTLRISNAASFGNREFDRIEGAQGGGTPLAELPIPPSYREGVPPSALDASVLDLAHLYAAFARDAKEGTRTAPDFADAVRLHKFLDLIARSAATGTRLPVSGVD